MSTNILTTVDAITNLNPNWRMLYRKLRVNDEITDPENFIPPTSSYTYEKVHLIEKKGWKIYWTSFTAIGQPCTIVPQSVIEFNKKGEFIKGLMNLYIFGTEPMKKEDVERYLPSFKENFSSIDYWDIISEKRDGKIFDRFEKLFMKDKGDQTLRREEVDYRKKELILYQMYMAYTNNDIGICKKLINDFYVGLKETDIRYLLENGAKAVRVHYCMMIIQLMSQKDIKIRRKKIASYHKELCQQYIDQA